MLTWTAGGDIETVQISFTDAVGPCTGLRRKEALRVMGYLPVSGKAVPREAALQDQLPQW